jgi:predicted nucleotide-binding protein
LHTDDFRVPFLYWKNLLAERRDIFLGYCGSSSATAASIKRFLLSLGVTVLDWQTDFIPGSTILGQIEGAAARSIGAIFLFTKDDDLADTGRRETAVPRDNVVFEAGYFIGLKGKRNVLIIREEGSKMPADLGGDIYASLPDKSDTSSIERTLSAFLGAI